MNSKDYPRWLRTSNSDENELETEDPRLVMSVKNVLDDICVYIDFVDSEPAPLYHQSENTNDASQTIQFDDLYSTAANRETERGGPFPDLLPERQKMWRVCTVQPHVPFLRHGLLYDDIGLKAPAATKAQGSPGVCVVSCYYLDYDGERVIPVRKDVIIAPYPGRRKIRDLGILVSSPVFAGSRQERWALLFESDGERAFDFLGELLKVSEEWYGDVFIDFTVAFYDYPQWRLTHRPQSSFAVQSSVTVEPYRIIRWDDREQKKKLASHFETVVRNDNICRFEFSVLVPIVYGFISESRGYRPLNVHDMEEVVFRPEALDKLRIDDFHKETTQSLVHSYFKDKGIASAHPEVKTRNSGKGDGLVILIQGAPGVGKTATADLEPLDNQHEKDDRVLLQVHLFDYIFSQ
ncbi:hypothetical protein DL766_008666 [Monosporascus sp. MC13-8B]|nr:hypothetical protein DL763_008666 [Monosporascus cannonballus]RYP18453.1 hypothetical protein DL766_008666 [Monosporascus sp. MC13-8B]